MKALKSTKFIVLLISAALLIAGIVGITASAEDTDPSLEIFSKNLSYGGTIAIAFAVDAQNIPDDNVVLNVYLTEPTEKSVADYVVKIHEKDVVHDRDALVFLTPGIAAKDMTKQIYVKAHAVVNGADVYSETERYSVAEYAYDMQYRSKINEDFIKLGKALLEVGEQIQTLLPYNEDNSPLDFYYVSAEGGTVDGKFSAGLFKPGDEITLNYTGTVPEGMSVVWKSEDGSIANGITGEVSANSVYIPTFEKAYVSGAYYTDGTVSGTRHDDPVTVNGAGSNLGIANNAMGTFEPGTTYVIETDFTFNGGKPTNEKDKGAAFFGIQMNDSAHNSNMIAWDYINYLDKYGNAVGLFGAEFQKGVTYNIRIEYTVGNGNYPTSTSTADYAARTEYLKEGFRFFVNGNEISAENITKLDMGNNVFAKAGSDSNFWGLGIQVRGAAYNSADVSFSFDNTFISPSVEIDDSEIVSYYENTDIAGTRLDFSKDEDLNAIVSDNSHTSNKGVYGSATIENGALNVSDNPAWYGLLFKNQNYDSSKTYSLGTKYVFEADITYNGGASASSGDKGAAFIGFITKDYGTDIRNGDMASYAYANYENSDSTFDFFGADLKKGKTYKVTVVYTVGASTTIEVYLDLVKISNCTLSKTSGVTDANCLGFGFYFRGTGYTNNLDLTFDNVFVGVIEAE